MKFHICRTDSDRKHKLSEAYPILQNYRCNEHEVFRGNWFDGYEGEIEINSLEELLELVSGVSLDDFYVQGIIIFKNDDGFSIEIYDDYRE